MYGELARKNNLVKYNTSSKDSWPAFSSLEIKFVNSTPLTQRLLIPIPHIDIFRSTASPIYNKATLSSLEILLPNLLIKASNSFIKYYYFFTIKNFLKNSFKITHGKITHSGSFY